jgi:hypothetical protein
LLAGLQPLPAAELDQLLSLLKRVVEAAVETPEPPRKWATMMRKMYGLKPPAGSCRLWWFIKYCMDLGAYRDDAHLAA